MSGVLVGVFAFVILFSIMVMTMIARIGTAWTQVLQGPGMARDGVIVAAGRVSPSKGDDMIRGTARTRSTMPRPVAAAAAALVLATGLGLGAGVAADSRLSTSAAQGADQSLAAGNGTDSVMDGDLGGQGDSGQGEVDQGGDYGAGDSGQSGFDQGGDGSDGGSAQGGYGPGGQGQEGYGSQGGADSDGGADSSGSQSTQSDATQATASQSSGVVVIETDLKYQDSAAAGTGMVLTSSGQVLTNNHVIAGATSIKVTVPSTHKTYTADVVGTNATDDVALLQLKDASGLSTIKVDDDTEKTGQSVTAVGNSQGGGELMAANGTITKLDSSVTTQSEGTVGSETLDGMIETSADVVSGDSGGALLDSQGEVIGMNTAASTGSAQTVAYAIPIEEAEAIVDEIRAGDETDGVSLGYPAFLGVQVAAQNSAEPSETAGAQVAQVIDDAPAQSAGLSAGDTITAVDSTSIPSASALTSVLSKHDPGDSVKIAWTDTSGQAHTATVALTRGPAS